MILQLPTRNLKFGQQSPGSHSPTGKLGSRITLAQQRCLQLVLFFPSTQERVFSGIVSNSFAILFIEHLLVNGFEQLNFAILFIEHLLVNGFEQLNSE